MIDELPATTLLMACLLAATLLGALIGACLWHLRLVRRHAAALAERRSASERERHVFDTVLAQERERAALKHEQERHRAAQERERAERAVARHEALAVHEREQCRRIEVLEAEVLGLEERRTRRRGDAANEHGERLPGSGSARPMVGRIDDERLPVLNRRVGVAAALPADDALAFGEDLDIPALAESELPEAGDDLVLELLDGEEDVDRDDDER